jgi:ribosomal protein S6--L-glutamate ligase
MERRAAPGEFRANLHRGGTAHDVKLTPGERSTALKAARVLGLNVAGVDLLRGPDGPAVIEVNSSPGLEGIERASGKDVAGAMVEFLERNAAPGRTRDRVKG